LKNDQIEHFDHLDNDSGCDSSVGDSLTNGCAPYRAGEIMARADATNASARANSAIGLSAPISPDEYRRRLTNERMIRFAIPILLAAMAVAVGFSMIQHFVSAHTEAVFNAQRDLKQAAAMKVAMLRLKGRTILNPQTAGVSGPDDDAELANLGDYTHFVLATGYGEVIETSLEGSHRTTDTVFETAIHPPASIGDAPIAVKLTDGQDALVHVRSLPGGNVLYAIRSMSSVTSQWWSRMIGLSLLVGSALIALIAVGTAYYLQAVRASHADRICATLSERMQLALARGRCGIWDWDLRSGRIHWSASMFELIGHEPREEPLSFDDIRALMHDDDTIKLAGIEDVARNGEGSIDHELRLRHADGRWIALHVRADIVRQDAGGIHLVGFALDVTEQRFLEQQRRNADLRLRDAIESIPEAFVLWDKDNKLVVSNENYRQFHQLDPERVVAGMAYESVHAESRGPGPMQISPLSGESGVDHDHSYEAELADGRWLQVSERRTKDGGFVSLGTDITARKEQARRLMDNEDRLLSLVADQQRDRRTLELQAMKLSEMARKYREQFQLAQAATRAKSSFLANMSHELRTPLNAIVGFSQIMEQKLFGEMGSSRYDSYVLDIRKSGEQMLDMVSDLLHMSKIEAGKTQLTIDPHSISEPVARAVQAVRPAAAARTIAIHQRGDMGQIAHIDPEATTQILTHILGNAVKFSHSNGDVTVSLRATSDKLNLFIADRGIGIPSEAIATLGRPFEQNAQQLNNGMRGSGLGLAIATSLASLQGGAVRVRSQEGRGTVVMISLPSKSRPLHVDQDHLGWAELSA
jgi:two-component system, cell cycle sensor histidine kinase PleC